MSPIFLSVKTSPERGFCFAATPTSAPDSGRTAAPNKKPVRGGLTWRAFYSVRFAAARKADACEGETEARLKLRVNMLHYRNRLTMSPYLRGGDAKQVGAHPRPSSFPSEEMCASHIREAQR